MRKLKTYICVIMCIICTLLPLYDCIDVRAADLPGLNSGLTQQIINYCLSQSGYMEISGGGGHKFGKAVNENNNPSLFQRLRNVVTNAISNANITFNNNKYNFDVDFTKNIYYELNGGNGLGGNVAQIFYGNTNFDDYTVNAYTNGTYANYVNAAYGLYGKYICTAIQGKVNNNDNRRYTVFEIYDISNVAYIACRDNTAAFWFYNSSYNIISVPYTSIYCFWNGGSVAACNQTSGTWNRTTYNITGTVYNDNTLYSSFPDYSGYAYYSNLDFYGTVKTNVNYPLIVGLSEIEARRAYLFNQNPTYVIPKTYNIFPSIDNDTINNTDFSRTYNTYVNNVNNTYNQNNPNGDNFDMNTFTDIARDQLQLIYNAIEQGAENITQVIETQTEKLNRIIDLLEEINEILQDDSGGGGSLTAEEITQLLSDLAYIKNNVLTTSAFNSVMDDVQTALNAIQSVTSDNYNQLEDINDMLIDIYHAIVGQNTTTNNYYYGDNYYINNYHNNNNNMDDFIDDAQDSFDNSVIDAMKGVVPFVFIIMAGSLFEKLSTDPEAPRFEIPFKIDSFGIDQTITIDLSDYGAIHTVLDIGWCMLLIAALMVVTFKALYLVGSTFF